MTASGSLGPSKDANPFHHEEDDDHRVSSNPLARQLQSTLKRRDFDSHREDRDLSHLAYRARGTGLPVYLDGPWASIFSFESGKSFLKMPHRWHNPIQIHFGILLRDPLDPTGLA